MNVDFSPQMLARLEEAALDLTMTLEEFVIDAVDLAPERNERDRLFNPTDPVELAETRPRMAETRRKGKR